MKLTPEQLHILQHSLGVDKYGHGRQYRNHFATSPEGDDWNKCVELCRLGFMADGGPVTIWGGMHNFYVTDAGKKAVSEESPPPPKLTRSQRRYREFLHADSGMSFKEWLTA